MRLQVLAASTCCKYLQRDQATRRFSIMQKWHPLYLAHAVRWRWTHRRPIDRLIRRVAPFTMVSAGKLEQIDRVAREVTQANVTGDFVECGTCRGGSAAILASALPHTAHLWLYDSFQGLPDVVPQDGELATQYVGACRADQNDLESALKLANLDPQRRTIRAGWFQDTFSQPKAERVAVLHLDCDWYESVLLGLRTFYPLIPIGGAVILDDFGSWEGCREAFYDFCRESDEKPLLWRTENDQAHWFKGQTHARDWS